MKLKTMQLKNISWKLTIIYASIFSLLLILLSAGILYGVKYFLVQQSKNQVENSSRVLIINLQETPNVNPDLTDPELLNEAKIDSGINVKFADIRGNIVGDSKNFDTSMFGIVTNLGIVQKVETSSKHMVLKNTKVFVNGKFKVYLQVAKDMEKEYAFINLLFIVMAVADSIGILISLILGYIISKEGLRVAFQEQTQFVSDASHELRTPISVIQGYINLIDRWGKDDKAVLQESIEAIKNETKSMGILVEDLLFLAKGDVGSLGLQKEKFDLGTLFAEIIKESKLIAPEKNLSYQVDSAIELSADRRLIKQLLRALVDNSIKFTSANEEVRIHGGLKGDKVKITVKDEGVGILPGDLENIFNRFYKVDKSRTKDSGGSGLGLSIVKWIVDAHGGKVYAKGGLEKGTEIIILI